MNLRPPPSGQVPALRRLPLRPVTADKTRLHHSIVVKTAASHLLSLTAVRILGAAALIFFLCALPIHSQQKFPGEENTLAMAAAPAEEPVIPSIEAPVESSAPVKPSNPLPNDRLFFVMPNYLMVEGPHRVSPLPVKTKFMFTAKTMTDPVTVSFLAGIALIGQARNSDPSYGQGLKGYGRRYATVYADTGIGTLMTASVFPTVLHQDPRYFQLGTGGFKRRTLYALSRIFITQGDNGSVQFNYSEIVGNGVAAGISNTYHPQSQRTLGNTLGVWASDTMLNALCNVAKEFWPDLRRKLRKPRE